MRLQVPQNIYGGVPAGLITYLGLDGAPLADDPDVWEVTSSVAERLVSVTTLRSPGLRRDRFELSVAPTPEVPGGMTPELREEYERIAGALDAHPTLASRFERMCHALVSVEDSEVPNAIKACSDGLAMMVISEPPKPLFPDHSVHDIRIAKQLLTWVKMPQVYLRLKYNTAEEIIGLAKNNPGRMSFESSTALLEGAIMGGVYFAPLLGSLSPMMWGFGAARIGQVVIYTLGRQIGGRGDGPSRDPLDGLAHMIQHAPAVQFDTAGIPTELHKDAYAQAVDWWADRINDALRDLYDPTRYTDSEGNYLPEVHQRWMLNFEELLSRISAITRHPRDGTIQLITLFTAMDLLGDAFCGCGGIGQLMTPQRISKRINAIEGHVPDRIRPLILSPARRALAAADRVADEFFIPDGTTTSNGRLIELWNARRNATHGFNQNGEILAEHTGRLPADIVLVPMVYLLDILTDRDGLLKRIEDECRGKGQGRRGKSRRGAARSSASAG